jgi:hypothetical protein
MVKSRKHRFPVVTAGRSRALAPGAVMKSAHAISPIPE